MYDSPECLHPLDGVGEEEKTRQHRKKPERENGNQIERSVCECAAPHFPCLSWLPPIGPGSLLEPKIRVDNARRALEPDQDPQPPTCGVITLGPNPVGGRRGK